MLIKLMPEPAMPALINQRCNNRKDDVSLALEKAVILILLFLHTPDNMKKNNHEWILYTIIQPTWAYTI